MLVILRVYPVHRTLMNQVGRIFRALIILLARHGVADVFVQHQSADSGISTLTAVFVEEIGIIQVCLELANIAKELINATLVGGRLRAFVATSPFAKHSCSITLPFQDFWYNDVVGIVWQLSHS